MDFHPETERQSYLGLRERQLSLLQQVRITVEKLEAELTVIPTAVTWQPKYRNHSCLWLTLTLTLALTASRSSKTHVYLVNDNTNCSFLPLGEAVLLSVWAMAVALLKSWENQVVKRQQRAITEHADSLRMQLHYLDAKLKSHIEEEEDDHESASTRCDTTFKETLVKVVKDGSVAFGEDKTYPLAHKRLNNFEGMTLLDFEKDVLSALKPHHREAFVEFYAQVCLAVQDLVRGKEWQKDSTESTRFPDEYTSLRFLQADEFDVSSALKRLLGCIQWRMTTGLDKFLSSPDMRLINRYRRLRVRRLVGMDKSGSPLVVERLGEFIASEESFKGGLTLEQWIMCYSYDSSELMAAFRECAERTGRYGHRLNYIGDLSGARLSGAFRLIPVLKMMTKAVENNFPEIAGNLIFINAPSFTGSIWSIVKRFLDPKTASKISIFVGPSKEVLLELCGQAVLPEEFGGTNPYVLPHPIQKLTPEFERDFPLVQ